MIRALLRIALSVMSTLGILAGCASPGGAQMDITAPPGELYATLDDVIRAATTALAEKRLGDPVVERKDNGAVVVGTLSGLAGAVYNSYGGTGRVVITAPFPGSTRFTVSAATRSRIAGEPVGAMDTLKGYNYNDPKYAAEIVQRIRELLPQGDVAKLRAEDERVRLAMATEEARRAAEAKRHADELEAERVREAAAIAALEVEAAAGSRVRCMNEVDCRKAFQLAQIYVSTKSDMKIQLATDTIIETYNPTESYRLGAKVIKMPGAGQSAEIVLAVTCKECGSSMRRSQLMLMRDFRPFVEERLRQ